jgi:hypothetical protein
MRLRIDLAKENRSMTLDWPTGLGQSVRIQSTDGVRNPEISVLIFDKMPQLDVVNEVNGISR